MFQILAIFALPALAAFFIGKWIDTTYSIKPYGTLSILLISFILSWVLTIRIYLKLQRQYDALDVQEEEEKLLNSEKE
ncbi:MAG: hypothetical protein COV59_03105 [Candidatus Magasanikbacteria bacterium CG11_big_fil_rev_8_21_14_0_20_39_34]|uniref:Uncharacterized protein n=1 Tax=Candidatus Magasanikbacteria bacterium CG11_big_fil_rev_8_21_14_0_20_39_34 TaxID=1974653 RepID=A0A2H0N5H4_9BACT|nr:MAG: hypothetical protein COV59_03105 [Candidatus Magasanikbacteria bacterium CG11_big_fil_rev_8_21_14_0_20_39_34]